MLDVLAGLVGGAVSPLLDRLTEFGASLVKRLALFLAAAICLVVVVIASTIAFALWVASLAGAVIGALAVAALYLVLAVIALFLALRGKAAGRPVEATKAGGEPQAEKNARVDRFTAPLLDLLSSLGLRREQIAVLAGASLAKRLGPVPLVGLAIVAGFLVGRLWRGWRAILSSDLIGTLLHLVGSHAAQPDAADARETVDPGVAAS